MSQKEMIISLLQINGAMTQGALAEAIYGDKLHMPNIYNDYITRKLDELGITTPNRKRKFDHFIWYKNR